MNVITCGHCEAEVGVRLEDFHGVQHGNETEMRVSHITLRGSVDFQRYAHVGFVQFGPLELDT
jgi:hypothetical protein